MHNIGVDEHHQQGSTDGNRREHADEHAQTERNRETFNRAAAQNEQDQRGNHNRHIRVENRRERAFETGLNRQAQYFTGRDFFLKAFENQNVRVDRHTDGKNDTSDARQGQCRMQSRSEARRERKAGR